MTTYELQVENRYESWSTSPLAPDIDPLANKLFSGDTFSIDCNNKLQLINSNIRSGRSIPGVLIVSDNKTYGRKYKRLLYKCVPDDKSLPVFLVPYEIKHVGFSKVYINLYVTFMFLDWDDRHPHGILNQTIGPVDVLDNFYEYRLFSKQLNISLQKFQKEAIAQVNKNRDIVGLVKDKYPTIEDREQITVFSIDPDGCVDFDDAFSITDLPGDIQLVSVYIANVPVVIDALNLWDSFSKRTSTIYLPESKRPMLPTILSDKLCSLQAGVTRVAFHMDVYMRAGDIVDIKFGSSFVKLDKNYCYEESALLKYSKYTDLLAITRELNAKNRYLDIVGDSHDVVAYLMILMNYHCAKKMLEHKTGIFRSTIVKPGYNTIPSNVPEDVSKFLKIFNSAGGKYVYGDGLTNVKHDMLGLDAYIHITSPIRRLVDLLNMIQFQQVAGIIKLPDKAVHFYQEWIADLDYINQSMKSIRKVQNECCLLELCTSNPTVVNGEHTGYVFNKELTRKGLNQYTVYLPALKLMSKITTNEDLHDYACAKFRLYLFNDEESLTRKIRLQLQT